jgi:putative phage-type endonuclease
MTTNKTEIIDKIVASATSLGDFESGTPEWHALRDEAGVVSGSEVGTILGFSPWKSAFTLWAEKTGKIDTPFEGNVAMRLGQLVEPAILQLYKEQHVDHEVVTVGSFAHKDYSWAHANPDGIGVDENQQPYILEIKHSSQYWDSVPENYRAQVLWYMWVFNVKKAVFAVVNAGRYKEYEVVWDDFEFAAILQQVTRFRQKVLDDLQPDWDGSTSTFETVRSLSPDIQDTKEELGQLGVELFNANIKVKEAETHLTEMKSRVLSALNGAKYGTIEGKTVVTLSQRGAGKPFLTIKEGN